MVVDFVIPVKVINSSKREVVGFWLTGNSKAKKAKGAQKADKADKAAIRPKICSGEKKIYDTCEHL